VAIAVLSCQGCGRCSQVCPADAILRNGGKVVKIDEEKCMEQNEGCRKCVEACPYGALVIMD
jgi:Fe-S-cluster-containing dehydrogenase component